MATSAAILEVRGVSKYFTLEGGESLHVLDRISFAVAPGEIVGIIGPSGCGKTTLLRIVSGLVKSSEGHVCLEGEEVLKPDPRMVLVFQEYSKSLFPWKTVAGNVHFGLRSLEPADSEARSAVLSALSLVGLQDFADEYPWRLSGGMQQRVALARALVRRPKVLLMDEPLGSLDAHTRYILEDELLSLAVQLKITVVLVTHDVDESVYLADRVIVLSARPASILLQQEIELARPRDQVETRSSPRFGELRGQLQKKLRQTKVQS